MVFFQAQQDLMYIAKPNSDTRFAMYVFSYHQTASLRNTWKNPWQLNWCENSMCVVSQSSLRPVDRTWTWKERGAGQNSLDQIQGPEPPSFWTYNPCKGPLEGSKHPRSHTKSRVLRIFQSPTHRWEQTRHQEAEEHRNVILAAKWSTFKKPTLCGQGGGVYGAIAWLPLQRGSAWFKLLPDQVVHQLHWELSRAELAQF